MYVYDQVDYNDEFESSLYSGWQTFSMECVKWGSAHLKVICMLHRKHKSYNKAMVDHLCNTYLIYSRDLNKVFATPTHVVSYLWKHCAIFCPDEIHATDCSIEVKLGCKIQSTMISQERRLEVNEVRMLRWMCGVTKKDKIRNDHVRGWVKVAPVTKKITEGRLMWYGHCVKRRDEGDMLKRMVDAPVPGKSWRGRQKTRRKDSSKRCEKSRVKFG